jgi:hypothetical protein
MNHPEVLLVMKPVDGGRAVIGIFECPHCGETHYTTLIQCGERDVFCGTAGNASPTIRHDGWSTIIVSRII